MAVDLASAFQMTPEKAAEYLRNKVSKVSWNWREVFEGEHEKIFTVAKTAGYNVLADIREAVQKAIDEGTTLKQFQKDLKPILQQKGWWGKVPDPNDPKKEVQLGSVRRLDTIYKTNLRTSYQAGRYRDLVENADFRPYWQYIALMDGKTRKEHQELHGKVFRWDDPFWDKFFPPNDWGCRCTVKSLSQKDVDRLGLTVESSEGRLLKSTIELPGGEKVKSVVYKPENGKSVHTGYGWNYNPGKNYHLPITIKDPPVYYNYLKQEVQSDNFKNFLKGNTVEQKKIVGVLNSKLSKILKEITGTDTNAVLLSRDTITSHQPGGKNHNHPEIGLEQYQSLPDIFFNPSLVQKARQEGGNFHFFFYHKEENKTYKIITKLTGDRTELYLKTIFAGKVSKNADEIYRKD